MNWSKYNAIQSTDYANLRQSGNLIITNDNQSSWFKLYNYGSDGKLTTEKNYTEPGVISTESPIACDFSELLKATNLNDGKIRIELPGSTTYDIYEWTFSDGTQTFGNPLIIDCKLKSSGIVTLDVWNYCAECPTGKRRQCRGTISYTCQCGEKKEKPGRYESSNAGGSGKTIRIDATIWVKDGEIGCRSKHFGKNIFGVWVPLNWIYNTTGIFANIVGSFQREVNTGNCMIVNQAFNEKQHPGGPNGSWQNIISQPGKNYLDPGKLSSGHRIRLKTGGTFFGFGVDKPRLVLD